jgi:hypothetical protein
MCDTRDRGKRKELKRHKGMLMTEKYTHVHKGQGHGVSWEQSHKKKIKTHSPSQPQPKSATATHSTLPLWNSITSGTSVTADATTLAM